MLIKCTVIDAVDAANTFKIEKPILTLGKAKKGLPVGTEREWKGKKFKKVSERKWVLVGKDKGNKISDVKGKFSRKDKGSYEPVEFRTVDADLFIKSLEKNIPKEFTAFVSRYSPEEYKAKNAKLFLSKDRKTGFAIADDGDIISVYSGVKRRIPAIMEMAIKSGGNKLDCFGWDLAHKYSKFGFAPVKSEPWNEEYKPDKWNTKEHDHPPVVYMELQNTSMEKSKKVKRSEPMDKDDIKKEVVKYLKSMTPEQRAIHKKYADFMAGDGEFAEETDNDEVDSSDE